MAGDAAAVGLPVATAPVKCARLELNTVGDPGTLGVIVGSGYGYKRPDGICVIPVAALGP